MDYELSEWIGFFLPVLISDGQGGSVETIPSEIEEDTPASVIPQTGNVAAVQDQLADRRIFEVKVRFQDWITSSYRISWRGRILDQISPPVNMDSKDEWIQLRCEQRERGNQ